MNFVAIDFETATADRFSACAIGVTVVNNASLAGKGFWLIQPPGNHNQYDGFNIDIHGITHEMTANEPTLQELWHTIVPYFSGQNVVAHNAGFDMSVLRRSLDFYGLVCPEFDYFCTRVLARRHWPDMASYALPLVAERCGVSFNHHEPADDAYAAAAIGLHLCSDRQCKDLFELSETLRVRPGRMLNSGYQACMARQNTRSPMQYASECDSLDEEHPLYAAKVVFTGEMKGMTRDAAMQRLVNVGGIPSTSVSSKTRFLVVGLVDFDQFVNGSPSGKLRKAMDVKSNGGEVEIISEKEFLEML